jgi:hypothetical protein
MKVATFGRAMLAAAGLIAGIASAQAQTSSSLPNSTLGFGDGQLLRFVYSQNFDCRSAQ